MCVDILNKRPTEIGFINGSVVRLAKKHNVDVPLSTAMTYFIRALESKY